MAKRRKTLPARPPVEGAGEEHSLLLRSAESLGRVIGALQRQLDDATRRLSLDGHDGAKAALNGPLMARTAAASKSKPARAAASRDGATKNGATKKAAARKGAGTKRKRATTRH